MALVPLHNHSQYSALDGFATPEEIADRIVEIGCPCCGLTDHGVVAGHLHFDKALRAKGIKSIFGCEMYHGVNTTGVFKGQARDQAHLIALAMTDEGLRNLWRLCHSTARQDHFRYVGRVFWDDIEKYHEGIVFTSACALGLVPRGLLRGETDVLNRYLDICGDDFYIEIHTYPHDVPFKDRDSDNEYNMRVINEALVDIAQERGIPLVYANDAHYARADQFPTHDLYLALQTGDTIDTPVEERTMWHPPGALAIMDEAEVREALSYLSESVVDEAIANSVALGERANAHLPEVRRHLPVFVPGDCPWLNDEAKALSPEDLFVDLVEAGIEARYGEDAPEEVWDRTVYETETLLRDGIHHYFLMGWDEIQFAKSAQIAVGPGRGSSAGCIVAYALGITDVDPLHYGLIFERFWNSGRAKGFPDIDSDFSRRRRGEVIDYLKQRWGEDRVCAIGTIGYMKPKSVIDKLYKGCAMTFMEAEELKKIVGQTTKIDILGHEQIGWSAELEPGKVHYVERDCGKEITKWIKANSKRSKLRQRFVDACRVCCSRTEQYGIHASGIVISDTSIAGELPAYLRGGKDGVPATMFPMNDVDERQFIKLDVLGLRTLDVLEYWDEEMAELGITTDWSGLDKEAQEPEMWDLLANGFTAGIFQVEDGYGRQLCKRLVPASVEDVSVISALNRPGPIQAKIPDAYIARQHGEQQIDYRHPKLSELVEPILNPTYGLFVYQEQIIAFFNALGYTLSESDAMRKIMGKKKPEQLDAIRDGTGEWEGRGYFTMADRKEIPYEIAEQVWKELEGFADYCFNKSHTVAYSIISFRTLYAKYWAAAQSYAALIRSLDPSRDGKKRETIVPEAVNECRRLNVEICPPDIRYSMGHPHVTQDGTVYFGFGDIHSVSNSADYVVKLRDRIGLDISTPETFRTSFAAENDAFLKLKKHATIDGTWEPAKSPKQKLRANQIDALEKAGCWEPMSTHPISLTLRQQNEMEMLGVVLTDNWVEVRQRNADAIARCDSWDELLTSWADKVDPEFWEEVGALSYRVCGILTGVQEKQSKKTGRPFGIVAIEYDDARVEFTVFNQQWPGFKKKFKIRTAGIFTLLHQQPTEYGENHIFKKGEILT